MTPDAKWRALRKWHRDDMKHCNAEAAAQGRTAIECEIWRAWGLSHRWALAEMSRLSRQPKKGKKR